LEECTQTKHGKKSLTLNNSDRGDCWGRLLQWVHDGLAPANEAFHQKLVFSCLGYELRLKRLVCNQILYRCGTRKLPKHRKEVLVVQAQHITELRVPFNKKKKKEKKKKKKRKKKVRAPTNPDQTAFSHRQA
jgi:hypothetical protein